MTTLRAMTWGLPLDEGGIEPVAAILRDEEIDLAFLQLTLTPGGRQLLGLARQLGMHCDRSTTRSHVLATLYAGVWRVGVSDEAGDSTREVIFEVDDLPGAEITAVNVNFAALDPARRHEHAIALTRHRHTPCVIAGNFVSVPPHDPEPNWDGVLPGSVERLALSDPTSSPTADRRVGEELARAGFVDVTRMRSLTDPVATLVGSDVSYRPHQVWVSGPLAKTVTGYGTVDLPAVRRVGPVLPVVVEFDLARLAN